MFEKGMRNISNWLGRQVGFVKKGIETEVPATQAKVIYRKDTVQELPAPDQPDVKLRRTTIDEVIVEKKK